MARIGGGPSKLNATDDNDSNTDSDTEMEEELLKLYQQRPASLRVSDSGKKERDPGYHCLMEKLRCVSPFIFRPCDIDLVPLPHVCVLPRAVECCMLYAAH